jgi:formylglycine-generating enzyme required for sulfatase activity
VNRGGSWNNNAQNLRSANRNRSEEGQKSIQWIDFPTSPTNRNNNLGFRVARTPSARTAPIMVGAGVHQASRAGLEE